MECGDISTASRAVAAGRTFRRATPRGVTAMGGIAVLAMTVIVPRTGRADPAPGFYVGGSIGFSLLATQATTLDLLMGTPPATSIPTQKTGFGVGLDLIASAGYAVGDGLRFEAEARYGENGASHGGGTQSRYGVFTNAVYDADVGLRWMTPYLGVGIGYQITQWSNVGVGGAGNAALGDPISASVSGSTGNFAYQIIAGLAFPIEDVPGLAVTTEYRFTEQTGSTGAGGVANTLAGAVAARAHSSNAGTHSFLVGLRYQFNVEPDSDDEDALMSLPPAPRVRPAAARTYIVYFDRGSASLTPRAQDVVATAARASNRMAFTRIEVSGHADSMGSTVADTELSRARSDAVAEEMVRWGILRSTIDIHAFGDEGLAQKVSAGDADAKSRRVEIVYR
jgi:outer membrane protein OmpA-like peptidoglycan-associated protein